MKKILAVILSLIIVLTFAACSSEKNKVNDSAADNSAKLNIVCTIFPIYDWVKQIAGDKANITLLLDSGVDLHSYQPSASDIVKISNCDIFIYVGGESDDWAENILKSASNKDMEVIDLLDELDSYAKIEETVEGMQSDDDGDEDEDEYDEHIWLSLKNAAVCIEEIKEKLCEKDSENSSVYIENADKYKAMLSELDEKYETAASNAKFKSVLFADRFPFRYLFDDYNISYYAAFSGCSAESEASFETISFLANKCKELGLTHILTTESSDGKIAQTVIKSVKADIEVIAMDSMQSKTAKSVQNGDTYLKVMEDNLAVFTSAIS